MRLPLFLLTLSLLVPAFAAPPGVGTLDARLGLGAAPGLELTVLKSDAETARYQVVAPTALPAVAEAAGAFLQEQGWQEHPNVRDVPAPPSGVRAQVQSYVQGSELLELRVSQRGGQVGALLEATLVALSSPPQLAAAP